MGGRERGRDLESPPLLPDLDPATVTPEHLARASLALAATATRLADAVVAYTEAHPGAAADADEQEFTVDAVAALLAVPPTQVRRLIDRRALASVRVGRYLRVRQGDLRAYVQAHRTPARGLDDGVARRYSPPHDESRIAATPPDPRVDPGPARRRDRRPADDRRALGTGHPVDLPSRRQRRPPTRPRPSVAAEPLDVGAADAFPAPPEG